MSEIMAFVIVMLGFVGVGVATWIWTGRRRRPLAADPSIDWPPGSMNRRLDQLARPGVVLISLLVTGGAIGGGWYLLQPTWQEVYDGYVDQIDAIERHFYRIAQLLPAPGKLPSASSIHDLDPPPLYDRARGFVNTEFLSEASLMNPTNRNNNDLYLSGDLALYVYWRHSPPYVANDKAAEDMRARIEAALGCRYLVVTRSLSATDYEAFFFDLPSSELLFCVRFSGSSISEAASQLLHKLRMLTNGTFVGR